MYGCASHIKKTVATSRRDRMKIRTQFYSYDDHNTGVFPNEIPPSKSNDSFVAITVVYRCPNLGRLK